MRYDPTRNKFDIGCDGKRYLNPWYLPWYSRLYNAIPGWVFLLLAGVIYFGGHWLLFNA